MLLILALLGSMGNKNDVMYIHIYIYILLLLRLWMSILASTRYHYLFLFLFYILYVLSLSSMGLLRYLVILWLGVAEVIMAFGSEMYLHVVRNVRLRFVLLPNYICIGLLPLSWSYYPWTEDSL